MDDGKPLIDGCVGNPCYPGVKCNDVPAPGLGFQCDPCPQGYKGNGTHCEMCQMGVAIAASTAVDGAVPRGRDTRVIAAASLMADACSNADGYVFRWSAARSDGTPVALDPATTKSDTLQLFLPKKSLPPGVSYTLRFEGRQAVNPRVSSSVEFDFFVQSAALEPSVDGGDVLLSEGVAVALDATSSVDPDDETEYEWEFTWQCEGVLPTAGECKTTDGIRLELPRTSTPKLTGLFLAGGPGPDGQTYTFTLAARKGARRATATTTVAVVAAPAEALGPPPSATIPPFPGGKVNAGDVARIQAAVASAAPSETLSLKWSATRAQAVAGGGDGVDQKVDLLADDFVSSSSITTENLVLSPNALEAGWQYKLRLDVEDQNGVAAAFLTLQENRPPSGGTVLAFPQTGTAMSTVFELVAEAWTDADPPLSYRFTVQIKGQEGQPTQLQDFSPLAKFTGTLPGGLDIPGGGDTGVVIVGVEVMDTLGAVSQQNIVEVVSTWPVIESEEAATAATAALLGNAEAAIKAGGPEAAMGLVSGACQQLANFKQKQQRRRLLSSNGCVGGGGAAMTGAAAERAKQRESMLNVTKSASGAVPVSSTLIGGVANTAAQVGVGLAPFTLFCVILHKSKLYIFGRA